MYRWRSRHCWDLRIAQLVSSHLGKKTVVLGASPNAARYAYLAVKRLKANGHRPIPVGIREGTIEGIPIITNHPAIEGVDTITLYLRAALQRDLYDYIFSLSPKRLIFNPGAENEELVRMAAEKGTETVNACTLVMLATGEF